MLPEITKGLNYYKTVYICGMKLKKIKTWSWKPALWGSVGRDTVAFPPAVLWNPCMFMCPCLCACSREGLYTKGANVDMPVCPEFTRLNRCLHARARDEREKVTGCSAERESESQGQRVIRLFSVRPGKLSSLGDEKWLYGSMRVIEFCCTAKREDEKESKGKKNMHMIPAVATSCLLIISHFEQMPNHDAKDGKSA